MYLHWQLLKKLFGNPELVDYKTLAVKKEYFGNINLQSSFFDSFRGDYQGFDQWFNRKSEEIAYVCSYEGEINSFLFLKKEGKDEDYSDIQPPLPPKERLKIGTFKVTANGFKLGERFLKIIFDNALKQSREIYVTIFDKRDEQKRLIELINMGFRKWGEKETQQVFEKFMYVHLRNSRQNTATFNISFFQAIRMFLSCRLS